jgi:hypothetical protein
MRRREFITLLGGAAATAWPFAALAQQVERMRRVGVLGPADTPAARVAYPHFLAELRKLGFREGENLIVDIRRIDQGVSKAYVAANELVAAKTDILVALRRASDGPVSPKSGRQAMTLQEAKSIARHVGLTLRSVRSGDYRVNFRDGNETTA